MKSLTDQNVGDTIQRVADIQRRYIYSRVYNLIDVVSVQLLNNKDAIIYFNLDYRCIDNDTAAVRDTITTKLRYHYNGIDRHQVVDGIIDEAKQLAKDKRDCTSVIDRIAVTVEEDGRIYDYGSRKPINPIIFLDLKDIIDSVPSKELNGSPIMMKL